jgi:hypothetical protein
LVWVCDAIIGPLDGSWEADGRRRPVLKGTLSVLCVGCPRVLCRYSTRGTLLVLYMGYSRVLCWYSTDTLSSNAQVSMKHSHLRKVRRPVPT